MLRLSDGSRVKARILVDGTELGDVARSAGAEALDDGRTVQDMTYVAVLKEYDHDVLMEMPEGYDVEFYRNCCLNPLAEDIDRNCGVLSRCSRTAACRTDTSCLTGPYTAMTTMWITWP